MPGLVIWKTEQVEKLRKDMDRMFDRFCGAFGLAEFPKTMGAYPRIHLNETQHDLVARVEIHNINPEDISIDLTEDSLTVKFEIGKNTVRNQKGMLRTERQTRSFSRKFKLPCPIVVETVKASYKDGNLDIHMKKFEQKRSRTLKIEL